MVHQCGNTHGLTNRQRNIQFDTEQELQDGRFTDEHYTNEQTWTDRQTDVDRQTWTDRQTDRRGQTEKSPQMQYETTADTLTDTQNGTTNLEMRKRADTDVQTGRWADKERDIP